MADLATVVDVESRWRPLRDQEVTVAAQLLGDASASLRTQVQDLDVLAAADEDYADLVTATVAQAVVRVLRGRDPRDPADYSGIFFTRSELAALAGGGADGGSGAFTIQTVADPGYRTQTDLFGWA